MLLPLLFMVISILVRKTRIADRALWEGALETVLPRIREVLESAPGFVSVQYLWSTTEAGRFAQITTWESEEACNSYVRNGAAALVATIEESALPTAAYPEGAWVRQTFSGG